MDVIGWIATALFLASYSCKDPKKLRLTQAAAALLWVAYGIVLHAVPIVVANLLVAAVAAYSSLSGLFMRKTGNGPAEGSVITPASAADLSRISSPYS